MFESLATHPKLNTNLLKLGVQPLLAVAQNPTESRCLKLGNTNPAATPNGRSGMKVANRVQLWLFPFRGLSLYRMKPVG
jgi:hypothetical protein